MTPGAIFPAPIAGTTLCLPGEWIDARGRPRPALRVGSIGVILPGGPAAVLAAEPALRRLRTGFPAAAITLLAEGQAGALALGLGLADRWRAWPAAPGAEVFDVLLDLGGPGQPAEDPPDAVVLAGLGHAGLGLAGLGPAGLGHAGLGHAGLGLAGLGPAGLGPAPNLAIAVPAQEGPPAMLAVPALRDAWLGGADTALAFGLLLEAENAHSPASAGLGDDERRLGFFLRAVELADLGRGTGAVWDGGEVAALLGDGWHECEPAGAWSQDDAARLTCPLPADAVGPFRVTLRLRGHVHAGATEAAGTLRAEGVAAAVILATLGVPDATAVLTLPAATPVLKAVVGLDLPAAMAAAPRIRLRLAGAAGERLALGVQMTRPDGGGVLAEANWSGRMPAGGRLSLDLPFSLFAPLPPVVCLGIALAEQPAAPLRIDDAWLLGAAAAILAPAARAEAWLTLAERCGSLLAPAPAPPLPRHDPRLDPSLAELQAGFIAARDAGSVVVALLQGAEGGWPASHWDALAQHLSVRPGVALWRPDPGIGAAALAVVLRAVDLVVGDPGLPIALAGRLGLTGVAILAPGDRPPTGRGLYAACRAEGVVPPADVLALIAPEIAMLAQGRQ